jgi:hypothetical protein
MRKKSGPKKITPYSNTVERHTKITYNLLSEKERRIYISNSNYGFSAYFIEWS